MDVDLNLLVALDALLAEGSVTGAAGRLGLSASAVSRTLTRLRLATGDPLLVRAGRGLVPTPYALALRDRVRSLNDAAKAILRPVEASLDMATLEATFAIRAGDWFLEWISSPLVASINAIAPHVRLRFAPKPDKDSRPLREGLVDLEVGVTLSAAPELRTQLLFRDRFVGVVRAGHPLLDGAVTPERFAACRHVSASQRGDFSGPVDEALEKLGLRRQVTVVVPGYPDAMRIARGSDLVAVVSSVCLGSAASADQELVSSLRSFALPVELPDIAISAMWHPRVEADPAHRWLRNRVIACCRQIGAGM